MSQLDNNIKLLHPALSPTPASSRRGWRLLLGVVFCVLLFAGFQYWAYPRYQVRQIELQLYADNQRLHVTLPAMPAPRAGDRILIVAPHPDDETIAFGGYIQQALAVGAHIHIVTITNGDARGVLSDTNTHRNDLPPNVFIRLGLARQAESRAAIRMLGLPPDVDTFLGYPDAGTFEMWQPDHWLPAHPVRGRRTRCTASPYADALTPGAIYCGQALTGDLETVMRREAPTILFDLDPNEQHPDHIAASFFTSYAFNELRAAGVPFTRRCQVYYYLVHRRNWPAPMAYAPDLSLDPPVSLYRQFPHQWFALPLTHAQTLRTHEALKNFISQGDVASPVLAALPRRNELFRRIPDVRWSGEDPSVSLFPVIYDPPADTVGSVQHPDADILQVQLGRDHERLLVKVLMRGTVTRHTRCTLCLHGGGDTPACRRILTYTWQAGSADAWDEQGAHLATGALTAQISGHSMLLTAPWPFSDAGPQRTDFFQAHAFTSIGKQVENLTMSQTVVMREGEAPAEPQ